MNPEQYYPTYVAKERDVLLLEFQEAQTIANSQTKLYSQLTNVLLAILTLGASYLFSEESEKANKAISIIEAHSIGLAAIIFLIGAMLLRYFVDLKQQITINARKVVTLRTLLGLDYGRIHLTIPDWRVEGANNPFVIKYFNGWTKFETSPFWILLFITNFVWFIALNKYAAFEVFNYQIRPAELAFGCMIAASIVYYQIFRGNLRDTHETFLLSATRFLASILQIRLLPNFEYILYRAKLSHIELDRLNIRYENLISILIDIEDKGFYQNRGYSLKSLGRALLSRFKWFRNRNNYIQSGASTITMQLARSLFIPANQNTIKRKIIEIMLARWLTAQFDKHEILKLYVCSVRYEKGVIGLPKAINHFLGNVKNKILSNEEAFFLVERLSNISSSVRHSRISHLTKQTNLDLNSEALLNLYEKQIREKRLTKKIDR